MRDVPVSSFELAADTVIVPNPGVARWLWLYLAKEHGVSANLDCVLPGSYIWRLFHRLLPDVPEQSPYEPAVMTWRLHRLLSSVRGDPAFSGLMEWRDTDDDRRRFELAQRLARLFDQYIVYRPDWIEQWRAGQGEGWQQALWRRLAEETAEPDWMGLRRRLNELDSANVKALMPARVSLFGIPLLSPGYLEVITWLSQHIEVNLFLPNPCREHWAHIVPERDLGRLAGVADEKTLYIETGNALLASWGGQGRDLLDLIQDIEPSVGRTEFVVPGSDTLLHAVQTQILELRDPGTDNEPAEVVQPGDRSIQIHVCHSPTRELEVLHDQLLALFDNDRSLSASDVIVMTPDIDAYAPFIDAVFATPKKIPFHIADVNPRRGVALIETFLGLFDLPRERFDANHVLAILEIASVRRRFGLAEADMRQVHDWVRETGVRWGLDAVDRAEFGRDDAGLHSWRHGLDRLLLGFALPGERLGTYNDVLPYDNVEGSAGLTLGSLAEFISQLRFLMTALQQSRTVADWTVFLHRQLDVFFDIREDQESEAQTLRDAINSLGQYAGLAGHAEPVAIDLVIDWITRQLDASSAMRGFLGHGVTFCGIVPMRSVPFPVVCLIGLNDDVFPRIERPAGFDLIASHPRRGDRSRRDDDRQAFLECLQNARDVFYLSYVGRGVRDDASIPPSVLVSEVVDYCNRSFISDDDTAVGDSLVTQHRVQAFSPRYFDGSDPKLFSYADIIAQPVDKADSPPDFLTGPLNSVDTELLEVDLDGLIRFYRNPAQVLLQKRLAISYEGEADPHDTDDPIVLSGLERWSAGDLMLKLLDAGHSREEALEIARNGRYTPIGQVGDVALNAVMAKMEQTWDELQAFRPTGDPAAINFEIRDAGVRLSGRLGDLYESGQYLSRHGRTHARFYLALWIKHLILNVERPESVAQVSHWRGDDATLTLAPLPDAERHLTALLQLFRRGMNEAIPFFSESSLIYARGLKKDGDRSAALFAAQKKYSDAGPYYFSEDEDPYLRSVFRNGVDWEQFEQLAVEVYGPIIEHLES